MTKSGRHELQLRRKLKLPDDIKLYDDWMTARELFVEASSNLFKRLHYIIEEGKTDPKRKNPYYATVIFHMMYLVINLIEDIFYHGIAKNDLMFRVSSNFGKTMKLSNWNLILVFIRSIIKDIPVELKPKQNVVRLIWSKKD